MMYRAILMALIPLTLIPPVAAQAQEHEAGVAAPAAAVGLPFVTIGTDIDGYWTDLFHEDQWDRRAGQPVGDFTGLPLNEAGKLAAASWNPGWSAIPEEQCRPHTGLYSLRGLTGLRIAKVVDPATYRVQRYDLLMGWSERTIWMDGRPHPPAYAPHSFAGFSTGVWEGGALKVTTTHVKAGYVQRNGPPHSDRAVGTEWFIRQGDTLLLVSLIDDPGYFSEPLIRTTNWALDKVEVRGGDGQIDCGPFQVVDERVGQPKHFVPHYLPGQYEDHKEFQTMSQLPQEAAFGGAETLYPEYVATLAELQAAALRRTTTARPGGRAGAARTDFLGVWQLDRSKSSFEVSWRRPGLDGRDGTAPERRVVRISNAPNGAVSYVIDTQLATNNDTGTFRVEYVAKPDGSDAPAKGGGIETYAVKRIDPLTIERTGKIKGAVVETGTWKLSPDGKTLTVTAQGKIGEQGYRNSQVFERIE